MVYHAHLILSRLVNIHSPTYLKTKYIDIDLLIQNIVVRCTEARKKCVC